MVETLKIACGSSWKSSRRSWIRKREDVGSSMSKIGGCINLAGIAGQTAGTRYAYVIHCSDNMYSDGSDTERPESILMEMIIHRNNILAGNND